MYGILVRPRGSSPLRKLWLNIKNCNLEQRASSVWMEPPKLFLDKSRTRSCESDPISGGMVPESRFDDRLRYSSRVSYQKKDTLAGSTCKLRRQRPNKPVLDQV